MDKKTLAGLVTAVVGLAAGIIAGFLKAGTAGVIIAAVFVALLFILSVIVLSVCQANYRFNRRDLQHANCNVAIKTGVLIPPAEPAPAPQAPARATNPSWRARLRHRRRIRRNRRAGLEGSDGLPSVDQAAAVPVRGPVEEGGERNGTVRKAKSQDLVRRRSGNRTNDPGHC